MDRVYRLSIHLDSCAQIVPDDVTRLSFLLSISRDEINVLCLFQFNDHGIVSNESAIFSNGPTALPYRDREL